MATSTAVGGSRGPSSSDAAPKASPGAAVPPPAPEKDTHPSEQTISVSDLLRELQETNRLLRTLVSSRGDASGGELTRAETLSLSRASTFIGQDAGPLSTPPVPRPVKQRARQLVEDLHLSVFGPQSRNGLDEFRDDVIKCIARPAKPLRGLSQRDWEKIKASEEVRLVARLDDTPASQAGDCRTFELLWSRRAYSRAGQVITHDQRDYLRRHWPTQFMFDRVTTKCSRGCGQILNSKSDFDGALCASPLFYGSGGHLVPASAVLGFTKEGHRARVDPRMSASDLASPGSLWHFSRPTCPDDVLLLRLRCLAFIAAVCGCFTTTNARHANAAGDFLHEFCAAWKPLFRRGRGGDHPGWCGNTETAYQHTIRCFSHTRSVKHHDDAFVPYVRCHRETGQFPSLSGARSAFFVERRMSVMCMWPIEPQHGSFRVLVLDDFQTTADKILSSSELFTDWEDRHFIVRGANAGYHLLQSVMHRMLIYWEEEWSNCLDELDESVNTKLHDILDDEVSGNLMFDTSFKRSQVYFRTLEMLRIFAESVRETGRDLQEMDPERLLQGSFRRSGFNVRNFLREDPIEDTALWRNWRILSDFQRKAEDRLLRRIAEKTEEIKSLRDGLFNASALREASRSTTMNRYVIVLTIMTVLYLPPNLTAAAFSTPLIEGQELAEVVKQFKSSTVILCIVTYAVSFSLVWLAEKWDVTTSLYRDARSLWCLTWERFRRRGLGEPAGESEVKKDAGPKRTSWVNAALGMQEQTTTIYQDKP